MKTALRIDITFEQLLSLVRQLTPKEKVKLSKEIEKEVIDSKLNGLLKKFHTEELKMEDIDQEVEKVRSEMYDKKSR